MWKRNVLFVVAGNLFLSRRLIHPLHQIVDAARDIAGGNWERRLPAQHSAEATVMAAAFNEMTESLCHRRAEPVFERRSSRPRTKSIAP